MTVYGGNLYRKYGGKMYQLVRRGFRGEKRGLGQAEKLAERLRSAGFTARVVKMGRRAAVDGLSGDYAVYSSPGLSLKQQREILE